ncbi:hypothetical protein D3C81_2171330 [compost metagenome]
MVDYGSVDDRREIALGATGIAVRRLAEAAACVLQAAAAGLLGKILDRPLVADDGF